ncbi:MAG TPA: N-acetylmuramoyl-L-alanine amidase [Bacteroidales bacterium]|nr:N-acetylmuramoyl-L-alanine amidase [Bacteroidales bacterium]
MREITHIAVHCTATNQIATVDAIKRYWYNELGWKSPGYHFIVEPDGKVVQLAELSQVTNGVRGFNSSLINVAYIGGIDAHGRPIDNRTPGQKKSLKNLLMHLKKQFPAAIIQGHCHFPNVRKDCPSFDAKTEYCLL